MSDIPKRLFINEYDWGLGGTYYENYSDAQEVGVKRGQETKDRYIKTHEYKLVNP